MKCPRDGTALAAKVYEAKIEVDECAQCHGTWLDEGELQAIQSTVERDYRSELGKPSDSVSEAIDAARQKNRGVIACPKCNAEMDVRAYGMGSQVVIDVCPEGHGMWLDAGELSTLEKFFEQNQADNPIPLHWRMWASVVGVFHRKK